MSEPVDPRKIEQDLRKGEEEIRKLKAEARSAELSSMIPSLPTQVTAGSLDAGDNPSPLGVVNAYRSLGGVADQIARTVPSDATRVWIIHTDVVTKARMIHQATTSSLAAVDADLGVASQLLSANGPNAKALPLPLLAATGVASSLLSLVTSALSSNTTVRSKEVSLTFFAVSAAVAKSLTARAGGPAVLIEGLPAPTETEIGARVADLQEKSKVLRRQLDDLAARYDDESDTILSKEAERLAALKLLVGEVVKLQDLAKLTPVLAGVEEAAGAAAKSRRELARRASVLSSITRILDDADALLSALGVPDANGMTAVQISGVYEANQGAMILALEPSFAGAESVYEELKGRKDRGTHSGTTVVSYVLLNPDLSVAAGGSAFGYAAAISRTGEHAVAWE